VHGSTHHVGEERVERLLAQRHGAHGHEAAGERLGRQQHVRLDVPVLDGPEAPRASHARLDLVGHEERAVLVAQASGLAEVVVAGQVHAVALDGLDDEGRDVVGPEHPLERLEVVEGDAVGVGEQRPEPLAEDLVAVERERPHGEPVERVLAVHQPRAARRVARELDGGLDRLRARVAEEHLVEAAGHGGQEALGQDAGQQRHVHLHHAREICLEHLAQCRHDGRVVPAHPEDPVAGEQVEVALPLLVEEIGAAGPHVLAVEAQGLEDLDHLGVEVLLVQLEVPTGLLLQDLEDATGHGSPRSRPAGRLLGVTT
jgi:hypothetical protein